jgi:hypothetical protein
MWVDYRTAAIVCQRSLSRTLFGEGESVPPTGPLYIMKCHPQRREIGASMDSSAGCLHGLCRNPTSDCIWYPSSGMSGAGQQVLSGANDASLFNSCVTGIRAFRLCKKAGGEAWRSYGLRFGMVPGVCACMFLSSLFAHSAMSLFLRCIESMLR